MGTPRPPWILPGAAAVALLCCLRAASAETFTELPDMPGAGPVRLSLPSAPIPAPVVVVVPDPAQPDRRAGPYVARLNAQGIAAIEIQPDPGAAAPAEAVAQRLGRLLRALVADRRFDSRRIAVLGFGRGGGIALGGAAGLPVAALQAGCPPVQGGGAAPVLLLGAGDPARGDCDAPSAAAAGPVRDQDPALTRGWGYHEAPRPAADPRAAGDEVGRVTRFLAGALRAPPGVAAR